MKLKNTVKIIAFFVAFIVLFSGVTQVMTVSSSNMEFQWMSGIYEEPENSLDAIYIGSSSCYTFWNHNIAWEEYGITVYPYACSILPIYVTEYMIKEARKTHPDSLYIVNINTLKTLSEDAVDDATMHRLLDYMPLSSNKLELTDYMCDLSNLSFWDRMQYYFPILRYHSRWNELTPESFSTEITNTKAGNLTDFYLGDVYDAGQGYLISDGTEEVSDFVADSVNSLLDYCDKENVNVLFISVPRGEYYVETVEQVNTVAKIIESRGYPVLSLVDQYEEIGLDLKTDYFDLFHTNIHGSIKYTYFLSEYLIEHYGFEDKRNDEAYNSWHESFQNYYNAINSYILDVELDSTHRAHELKAPNMTISQDNLNIEITWNQVDGADGYAIYKKADKNESWIEIGTTSELQFLDNAVETEKEYYYTVIPFREENGERFYGNHVYNGIIAST